MNSIIRRPLYIFPLNPDYVAARSLRSLRSNKQRECLVTKDYISVKILRYFNASLNGQNFYYA